MTQDPVANKMLGGESAIAIALTQDIRAGDKNAESLLVQRYRNGLLFFLARQCGDEALAEDIAHDTFVTVIQRLRGDGIEQPEKLSGFILSTAKNLLLAQFRKNKRRRTETDTQQVERVLSEDPSQEESLTRVHTAEIVREVLADLPNPRDRELLVRFYLDEEDKSTICQTLELSSLHFNRVIHRARNRMKEAIRKLEKNRGISLW